ncbi:MAG: hypothetical protein RMJ87_02145 [Cytophagales bacterium]|nr:hypothetical protein [Bernardetiaceae bacterium]MDW8203805.1 hypothetical protein [Cytophagales bacterium]
MKRYLNILGRLSVIACYSIGLVACHSQTPTEQHKSTDSLQTEIVKPAVTIRNEELARFVKRFPTIVLPYDTRNDSITPAVSPLRDTDLKTFLRKGSVFERAYPCYPMYRLPDYGNFIGLIFATLQEESGGLLLLLVTYSPEGKPIDELLIKDDYDTGSESTTTNTRFANDFTLEQSLLQIFYEPAANEEESIKEKNRKEQVRRYSISPEGKIVRQS